MPMQTSRSKLLGSGLVLASVLALPGDALAGWGDEAWGTMIWGLLPTPVPGVPGFGLIALALALLAAAAWLLRSRRTSLGLPVLLVLLAIPLVVAAGTVTVPNTFTNGTTADANEVNANFDAVESAVNDNDARIGAAESGVASNAAGIVAETARAAFAESANAMNIAAETLRAQAAEQTNAAANSANGAAITNETTRAEAAEDANTALISSLEARIVILEAALGIGVRFVACPDGVTVADTETGLLWERKTTDGTVHDVNSFYSWSSTGSAADGTAYTVFLADLNTAPGFAGHTDWRLPFISELQSILVGPGVTTSGSVDPPDPAMGTNPTGQATTCSAQPCIDPDFAAVGGPTASSVYWSASSSATNPNFAWVASFSNGIVDGISIKALDWFVRAVRAGSCVN